MTTQAELFSFIDQGIEFLTRPARNKPQGYAHLSGGPHCWELVISAYPTLRTGTYTKLQFTGTKAQARAMAHQMGAKPWNF